MEKSPERDMRTGWFRRRFALMIGLLLVVSIVSACGGTSDNAASEPAGTEQAETTEPSEPAAAEPQKKELVKVSQVTNWFAEPEHGGQYAALMKGFYEEAGLDMTIQPGGPQISSTQIVASGQAEFGMTQADSLLLARKEGIPLVAIAALFQKNPQGLIFHKEEDLKDFSDLAGRKVYVAAAAGYWEYIKKKYALEGKVEEMKYTGSLVNFINEKTSVTQGYVTAEPFALMEQGVETGMLLHADSGYNPYANILFTTEKMLQEKPELVKAFVEASIKGWDYYKTNYEEVNPFIQEKNPDMTLDGMKYGAENQMELVYGGDAETGGVGYMTEERWSELTDQLLEIGLLDEKEDVSKVYTNEYLPKK
ncbi:ABC transporter substrate-binding protein [Paenibacillus alkalitolerans]|uniref:ABC transporter substrate-binding protein n=1 Tax=Paenibacillus alkalitolerans TaxID=2799335 RepID=UPI001F18B93C|nr:ABC transporter substrate-binding protein [Paenibacillus alkalitolerans]